MKRRWNLQIWVGFLIILAGLLSYIPVFSLFPVTRDFPWVNLLLFLAGGWVLGAGLRRAFRQPDVYRGKLFGSILAILSLAGVGLFLFGLFYLGRQLPVSATAPRVGEQAPDFALPDQDGKTVSFAELLSSAPAGAPDTKARAVLLIFYRGHW
jgi:hypothetical protein